MGGMLTPLQLDSVFIFLGFLLGCWLGPRLRDWWKGVPAPLRNAMTGIEATALATMHKEMQRVVDDAKAAVMHPTIPTTLPTTPNPPVTP
jgi:hypothetical protein